MPPAPEPTPLSFFRAFCTVMDQPPGQEYSESTVLEKALEALVPRIDALNGLPIKYLRALVDFTDFRVLQLTQRMAQANDTITVAHIRGQLREVEILQNTVRWWLDIKKEERNG